MNIQAKTAAAFVTIPLSFLVLRSKYRCSGNKRAYRAGKDEHYLRCQRYGCKRSLIQRSQHQRVRRSDRSSAESEAR